jgi:hypothetical protein
LAPLCCSFLPGAASLLRFVGSESQRPFAIVIVGGFIVDFAMRPLLLPTVYLWFGRPGDKLPSPERPSKITEQWQPPDKLRRMRVTHPGTHIMVGAENGGRSETE